MIQLKSEFLYHLDTRGFLHQCSGLEDLDHLLVTSAPITAYIGFDCTADSLHVGNLLQIMMLRWLQKTGHRPIVLLGGGTSRIGDPSGKDRSRTLLTEAQITHNMEGISRLFSSFLRFGDGSSDAKMVNNADWLNKLEYIPFLRDFGRHFTVNRMLTFESVKGRLDRAQPLSFLEFNYMILQAYDFLELSRRHRCCLQMGGADQWGNIVNGIELARRLDRTSLYGLTSPLLTTSSGAKMGKTVKGALWLDAKRVSAYEYWQFWRNTSDEDVGRFLGLFTDLPLEEIKRLTALQGAEINEVKKILANEATKLVHGAPETAKAAQTALTLFEQGNLTAEHPMMTITHARLAAGISILDMLVEVQLVASKAEARRLVRGGGAKIAGQVITDERTIVTDKQICETMLHLTAGKKRHVLVKVV